VSLAAGAFAVVVGLLSIPVVVNLLSSEQQMNASFAPLHLVNRYGAFGSNQPRPQRGGAARHARRGADRHDALGGLRAPVQAGRRHATTVHRQPVALPARLADVVRRHVDLRRGALDGCPRRQAPARRPQRRAAVRARYIRRCADAPMRRCASCAPSSIATSSRRAGPRHGGRTRGGESMRPMAKEDPDLEAFLCQNGLRRR